MKKRYTTLLLLIAGILAIFFVRASLANTFRTPYTFQLFDTLTVAGALFILLKGYRSLRWGDWITALVLSAVVGGGWCLPRSSQPILSWGLWIAIQDRL
jgi:hypothetical protein